MKLPYVIVQMAYAMMILSQSLENRNILKTLLTKNCLAHPLPQETIPQPKDLAQECLRMT